jgi:hypothetical protein
MERGWRREARYKDSFDRTGVRKGRQTHAPSGRQFPAVVRPRFRGLLRFAVAEDCSTFAVVGDAVSPPPLRFSVAFGIEGVDDPAEAEVAGLGACACCGVPFALSSDDDGEDVDSAFCEIAAGGT